MTPMQCVRAWTQAIAVHVTRVIREMEKSLDLDVKVGDAAHTDCPH